MQANALDDPELSKSIQGLIISLGEKLENRYGFRGSAAIKYLEDCCEQLYAFSNDENYDVEALVSLLSNIGNVIDENVEIKPCRLAVVAILKNEARYIREWIAYHHIVGVEHFYLYDNESTDDLSGTIKDFIDRGWVTYIEYPGNEVQLDAYNDAIKNYGHLADQMAFIDGDEYIVSTDPEKKLPQILYEIYDDYNNKPARLDIKAGGIGINWKMYGTSGHDAPVDGLLTENYLYRANDRFPENAHIKTICNPRVLMGYTWTSHIPSFKNGYAAITENGSYLANCHVFYDAHYDKLQINHYYTKSKAEFFEKLRRGWPDQPHVDYDEAYINRELEKRSACNEVYDPIMKGYSDRIKELL
ncbi:MAG: glycosyltransferase family 92 protein [Lachnospiraceae bacterium]|nr:glycosyltransferase family 92 protein [Lachnospiraceae bacterium]